MNNNMKKLICFEDLRVVKLLGQGAMGTVLLVVNNHCESHPFALKLINKPIKDQRLVMRSRAIEREREILSSLNHPFLPHLMGEIETESIVGWAIEYCPGGDLHNLRQIQPDRTFSVSAIRFYAAEIVLALEYLHSHGIAYRDLKPENILLQSTGHIMLTDFDLSIRLPPASPQFQHQHSCKQRRRGWSIINSMLTWKTNKPTPSSQYEQGVSPAVDKIKGCFSKSNSFVGTDEYVAPEIVRGEGHEFAVDWWALGILLYEMMYGKTPFKGSNKRETYARILFMEPRLTGLFSSLHHLIRRLLEKEPQKRLGFCYGAHDVKRHEFFSGVKWDSIQNVCRPPVVPDVGTDCKDNVLFITSDLPSYVEALHSGSEVGEGETTDSDADGLF